MDAMFKRYLVRLEAWVSKQKDVPYNTIKATLLNCWEGGLQPERAVRQAYKLLMRS